MMKNNMQWVWKNKEAFGNNAPTEIISGFKFNLRFPGQYFDNETNLNYNIHRDYNPVWGRYTTSDPLGLAAGINTYGYVGGNSLGFSDKLGLYYDDVVHKLNDSIIAQINYEIIQIGLINLKNKFAKTTNSEAIFSHGNSTVMNGKTASEWVKIIKNKPYYNEYVKNGKTFDIHLYACHTGQGDNSIAELIAKELPPNFVVHAPTGYLVNWGPYHFDTPFIGSDPFFGAFFPKGKWLQFKGGKMNE